MARPIDDTRLAEIVALRQAGAEYRATHRREFTPNWYGWQREFFGATRHARQAMLLAANRIGKTFCGGYAMACDLTGDYPEDWPGERIEHVITAWAYGVDAQQARDVIQRELLGEEGEDGIWRGGWIHHEEILGVTRSQLVGAVNSVRVKHKLGGVSMLHLKAYSQTRTGTGTLPHAGSSVDVMWVDEQPPDEVIGQMLTRLTTGRHNQGGFIRYTMTPELGMTNLVAQFMEPSAHQCLIGPIDWLQAPHISASVREELLATYPAHERDMRTKGIPLFGSGRIFVFDEDAVRIAPFDTSQRPWLRGIRAMDIGIDHPTAIVWLLHDPESDIIYLSRTYRSSDAAAAVHASVANSMWPHVPLVVPPDIDKRDPGSGDTVRDYYTRSGVTTTLAFKNPDGSNHVEPGIFALSQDIIEGRFRVFAGQAEHFIEEARTYHRDERGKIVKVRDDVIDAVRYGAQMVRQHGAPIGAVNHGPLYIDRGLRSGNDARINRAGRVAYGGHGHYGRG